jgi:hypothetical protein
VIDGVGRAGDAAFAWNHRQQVALRVSGAIASTRRMNRLPRTRSEKSQKSFKVKCDSFNRRHTICNCEKGHNQFINFNANVTHNILQRETQKKEKKKAKKKKKKKNFFC